MLTSKTMYWNKFTLTFVQYTEKTMIGVDYEDDLALFANLTAQAE